MSKGNLFLGMARGKVGDVVFARQYGEQIARARNRSPKNPQTPLQLLQRVVLKTASTAYSLLQEIADHSYQGAQQGTPNQSRFIRANVELLRARLADEINSGDPETIVTSTKANYSTKANTLPEINAYQVSEGSLAPVDVLWDGANFALLLPGLGDGVDAPTYQQIVDALGLQRGDQLTFLWLSTDDRDTEEAANSKFNGFAYSRVILDPANGNMDSVFMSTGGVANPNERNEGAITLAYALTGDAGKRVQFTNPAMVTAAGSARSVAAAAVIVSRQSGGVWQRSTEYLALRPSAPGSTGGLNFDAEADYLGDAVLSFMSEAQSSLYLNQAESF